MKKLMFLMMALLVAPAMGAVTISLEQVDGECALDLVVTADGADTVGGLDVKSLVAGIALNVSVGAGEEILSITGFMTTGVGVAAAPGYGIYMGNITFLVLDPGGPNEETVIDAVGSPVAPASAPDNPGQLPGGSCVLEFAGLFDVGIPDDAPDAATTLCRINVSDGATVTVSAEDITRGGIVIIGGTAPSSINMAAATAAICAECYTGPDQAEWVAVGKPNSWCNPQQCHGDADGIEEDLGFNMFTWVGSGDVAALIASYRALLGTANENLATDFDHEAEDLGFNMFTRTGAGDVATLIQYYRNLAVPGDCNQ